MSEASNQTRFRLAFEVLEDEDRLFRKLLLGNYRKYIDRRISRGIPVLAFAIFIFPSIIAFDRGWLPFSAVAMSEASFLVAYCSLPLGMVWATRRAQHNWFKLSRTAQASWECTFDDMTVVVKKGTIESRMTWDAISSVQNVQSIVVLWYDPMQGFYIPGRVFDDTAARISFAEWAAERVRAAAPAAGAAMPT